MENKLQRHLELVMFKKKKKGGGWHFKKEILVAQFIIPSQT